MRQLQEPLVSRRDPEGEAAQAERLHSLSEYGDVDCQEVMLVPERVSLSLEESMRLLDARLHLSINPDVKKRVFRVFGRAAAVYVLDGLVSMEYVQRFVIEPCLYHGEAEMTGRVVDALMRIIPVGDVQTGHDLDKLAQQLTTGNAILLCDGMREALCFDMRQFARRGISPPLTESVVNGPHQGFNESIRDNLTLLRRILPTPDLITEMTQVGDTIPTALSIVYLKGIVEEESLKSIKNRLNSIKTDHVLSIGALEQLIEDTPWTLLPQSCLTERPDRAASFLLEGQVVLVLDGSPQALAMPISFLHLLHTPDDTSMRWQTGSFLRIIRYLGILCTLLLPGLFAATVIFHPEVLPVTLLTSILESQAEVPLSIPVQAFLMLLMFNLIGEASTRVPSVVGTTLGTVSGLILGQAAVEARLIHPLLIIVVAVASLGSYAVPDYALSLAIRMGQLLFLGVGCIFGLYGMVLLGAAMLIRLCSLRSLGSPYAAPIAPLREHNPDLWLRWPIWFQNLRTWLADPRNRRRTRGPMRKDRA